MGHRGGIARPEQRPCGAPPDLDVGVMPRIERSAQLHRSRGSSGQGRAAPRPRPAPRRGHWTVAFAGTAQARHAPRTAVSSRRRGRRRSGRRPAGGTNLPSACAASRATAAGVVAALSVVPSQATVAGSFSCPIEKTAVARTSRLVSARRLASSALPLTSAILPMDNAALRRTSGCADAATFVTPLRRTAACPPASGGSRCCRCRQRTGAAAAARQAPSVRPRAGGPDMQAVRRLGIRAILACLSGSSRVSALPVS